MVGRESIAAWMVVKCPSSGFLSTVIMLFFAGLLLTHFNNCSSEEDDEDDDLPGIVRHRIIEFMETKKIIDVRSKKCV